MIKSIKEFRKKVEALIKDAELDGAVMKDMIFSISSDFKPFFPEDVRDYDEDRAFDILIEWIDEPEVFELNHKDTIQ